MANEYTPEQLADFETRVNGLKQELQGLLEKYQLTIGAMPQFSTPSPQGVFGIVAHLSYGDLKFMPKPKGSPENPHVIDPNA